MKYFLIALMIIMPYASFAADKGRETGLPTPRFVSLKSSEANMRKGPGTRYPIEWVYRKKGLPVEVLEEFGHWRRVRDSSGASGWLHKQMLSGSRYALIKGSSIIKLLDEPQADAPAVAKLEPGLVAALKECEPNWCRIASAQVEGWLPKANMYGSYDKELYNP